jgi:hypothetical protein
MATNLKSRITVLERGRNSNLPMLLISCGEQPTPAQMEEGKKAEREGRKVIFLINGDQFDDALPD